MPLDQPEHRIRFEKQQRQRVQGLQFRALEASYEAKEQLRKRHDSARAGAIKSKPRHTLSPGSIVSVCSPQNKLPKLTFQWSEPTFIITKVTTALVSVRDLTNKKGAKISAVKNRTDIVVNKKMTSLYQVPISFFLGAKVMKKFGNKWCAGTVDLVDTDEGETLWHDFDGEQMTLAELSQVITYHPLLDSSSDLPVPSPGSFIWYSVQQQPRLGRVVSVDPTVPRPVVVEVFVPQANAVSLPRAKFRLSQDEDTGKPKVDHITLHQIRLRFDQLTPRGFLRPSDRAKLQDSLES